MTKYYPSDAYYQGNAEKQFRNSHQEGYTQYAPHKELIVPFTEQGGQYNFNKRLAENFFAPVKIEGDTVSITDLPTENPQLLALRLNNPLEKDTTIYSTHYDPDTSKFFNAFSPVGDTETGVCYLFNTADKTAVSACKNPDKQTLTSYQLAKDDGSKGEQCRQLFLPRDENGKQQVMSVTYSAAGLPLRAEIRTDPGDGAEETSVSIPLATLVETEPSAYPEALDAFMGDGGLTPEKLRSIFELEKAA